MQANTYLKTNCFFFFWLLTTDSSMHIIRLWLMSSVVKFFQVGITAVTGQSDDTPSATQWSNSEASGTSISWEWKQGIEEVLICTNSLGKCKGGACQCLCLRMNNAVFRLPHGAPETYCRGKDRAPLLFFFQQLNRFQKLYLVCSC